MTQDQKQTEQELPPLPTVEEFEQAIYAKTGRFLPSDTYAEILDQMREYALAALSQVRGKAQEPIVWMNKDNPEMIWKGKNPPAHYDWIPLVPVAPQVAQEEGARGPDQALLISMACCLNHGFGMESKQRQEQYLYDMRKLYDEVAGNGYYKPENRERYLAMLNDEDYQSPSDKLKGFFAAAPQPDAQQSIEKDEVEPSKEVLKSLDNILPARAKESGKWALQRN